jgi:hypothetical protein
MHAHTAGEHSPLTMIKAILPKGARELIIATLLALSIMVNVWATWTIRDIDTRKWLHDWDLNQFETGPFADLKIQVGVDHELIAAFGPNNCKR